MPYKIHATDRGSSIDSRHVTIYTRKCGQTSQRTIIAKLSLHVIPCKKIIASDDTKIRLTFVRDQSVATADVLQDGLEVVAAITTRKS